MNRSLDRKEFARGVVSAIVVESQHLDPARMVDTVNALVAGRDLIVKKDSKKN
jgi:hypothetical protein